MSWNFGFRPDVLGDILNGLKGKIAQVSYRVGNVWHLGAINMKYLEGNYLAVVVDIPSLPEAHFLTGFRLLDENGTVLSQITLSLSRKPNQCLLMCFKIQVISDGTRFADETRYLVYENALTQEVELVLPSNWGQRTSNGTISLEASYVTAED